MRRIVPAFIAEFEMRRTWMTNATSGVCQTNGVDIHYVRTGESKPPVILLHGLTGSGACWTSLARALEREFDVVAPDARGHGKSSAPPQGYQYRDHARDVIGLIEALGLAAPVLLGHSMGGMTAAVWRARWISDSRRRPRRPDFFEPRAPARSSRERCGRATSPTSRVGQG